MHEALKVHHISYCIWGNTWFGMKKKSTFDEIPENGSYWFIALFAKFKGALITGENDTKYFGQGMSLKALRTLWISSDIKGFVKLFGNELCFEFL